MNKRGIVLTSVCLLLVGAIVFNFIFLVNAVDAEKDEQRQQDFIKWVDFDVPSSAMEKALKIDVDANAQGTQIHWIDLLAYFGAKHGGKWGKFKPNDMDALAEKLKNGDTMENLTAKMKYYDYYLEVYSAVLGEFVGEYQIGNGQMDANNAPVLETKYGLKAYSPIAYGYSFSHYDDFGNSRNYGYKRRHLGNDLIGSIGTPIVAVESGIIEHVGWNQYGGWRIGIRSLDTKRYYYYAHMRKNHPFAPELKEGNVVNAGDLIGYLGMTGYSTKENVNGMKVPHLHFGMQLIFDESQEEGKQEIWIDVYQIVTFLEKHKSPVIRDEGEKDYRRKYAFVDPTVVDYKRVGEPLDVPKEPADG